MKNKWIIVLIIGLLFTFGCSEEKDDFQNDTVNEYIWTMDDDEKRIKDLEDDNILRVYDLDDGTYNVVSKAMGYEEMIFINVILEVDDVREVNILYEKESEGYGDYIEEPWFLDRFRISGYEELELTKYHKEKDNEVVAVTGATISSRAVLEAVNMSLSKIGEIR